MGTPDVSSYLSKEGWSIRSEALSQISEDCSGQLEDVRAALLSADLRLVGERCLPQGMTRAGKTLFPTPCVLQVVGVQNVSQPSKGGASSNQSERLLCINLTDGSKEVKAIEYCPLTTLNEDALVPGCKLQITSAAVRCGLVLLDPKNFKVLGGRVDALAEAWEFQRRFGGQRPADSAAELQLLAPTFSRFVPGKSRAPAIYMPGAQPEAPQRKSKEPPPGMAPASSAAKQPEFERTADVPPERLSPPAQATEAAKQKLLERLEVGSERRGRGDRRGRGRRRRWDDEEDNSHMTLAEWESRTKHPSALPFGIGNSGQQISDEEIARKLQEELDLEAAPPKELTAAEQLRQSLFSFSTPGSDSERGRFGRGRGRRRGGRGRHS